MKAKQLFVLGICIAAASLLLSCATSNIIPVTGNESMVLPNTAASARDHATTYIQYSYKMPGLPAPNTWKSMANTRPDLVDMSLYTYTSGDWIITIHQPTDLGKLSSVTYINTQTDFVWHGFVDAEGNVSFIDYTR